MKQLRGMVRTNDTPATPADVEEIARCLDALHKNYEEAQKENRGMVVGPMPSEWAKHAATLRRYRPLGGRARELAGVLIQGIRKHPRYAATIELARANELADALAAEPDTWDEVASLRAKIDADREEISKLKECYETTTKECSKEAEALYATEKERDQLKAELETAKKETARVTELAHQYASQRDEFHSETIRQGRVAAEANVDRDRIKAHVQRVQADCKRISEERDRLKSDLSALQSRYVSLKADAGKLAEAVKDGAAVVTQAEFYTWKEKHGVTHFSQYANALNYLAAPVLALLNPPKPPKTRKQLEEEIAAITNARGWHLDCNPPCAIRVACDAELEKLNKELEGMKSGT
jgi:chromosome segregation ATPase